MKKPTAKSVQTEFDAYKTNVRAYVMAERNVSSKRRLMSIAPSNEKGLINGLTIPELVMLVNLSEGTGETIVLETENNKHDLLVIAKKNSPRVPWELL